MRSEINQIKTFQTGSLSNPGQNEIVFNDLNLNILVVFVKSGCFRGSVEDEMYLQTSVPYCADLRPADYYDLHQDGSVIVDGRILTSNNYCISGPLLWFCEAAFNRFLAIN